jgi:DNA-binding GntR family transcriptional regulator
LQVPSLVDVLYADIRERILTGALPGGSSVTEMDLATQYSVARPTAKASMERLAQEGLLHRASHKTARVPVLGVEDIRDLYYSRAFLEREVVMALAEQRLVPEKARASLRRLRDVETNPPLVEVVNVDVSFHSELVDAIGSPRLNRMYRSLMAEVRLCMAQVQANHLLSPSRIADEHSAILDRIENGDVDGALMHITEHLEQARTRLIAHVGSVAGKPEQRL